MVHKCLFNKSYYQREEVYERGGIFHGAMHLDLRIFFIYLVKSYREMPVILRTKPLNTDDPREITLDEYEQGRENFTSRYFLQACNTNFSGQDIAISWDAINNAVNSFISNYSVAPGSVAMRFVYCYDTNTAALYLRLQILTMQAQGQGSNIYDLIPTPCAWYEIREASFTATGDTDLFDTVYLNNLFYCAGTGGCDPESLLPLSGDSGNTYARTIT